MIPRVLYAQDKLFHYHLPLSLYSRIEIPTRHRGMNSIRIQGNSTTNEPPLVLLHGFGSGLGFFFATLNHLVDSGKTVYLVDWLGCGGSDRPIVEKCIGPAISADFFTGSLKDWLDGEKINKADIIGHSLGGLLVKEFSDKHPERVSKLILASPAGLATSTSSKYANSFSRQLLDILWSADVTPQQLVRLAGRQRGHTMVTRAIQSRFARALNFNVPLLADYLYEITVAHPSGEFALNALLNPPFRKGAVVARRPITGFNGNFPVHVIYGDRDWLGTSSAIENGRRVGAKVSIMQNATHHLYIDNPKEFARLCTLNLV